MRKFALVLVATFLALSLSLPAMAETLRRDWTEEEVLDILKSEGYGRPTLRNSRITFLVEGDTLVLRRYEDGDWGLSYGITGGRWSLRVINEWNVDYRFTRACLDKENDPRLEADLLADAGFSASQLKAFIKAFTVVRTTFEDFLRERDGK